MSAARRGSLAAILAACIAYGGGMGLTLPLLALILERLHVPGSLNGLNIATAGLAALAVTPFVPGWIVRFGVAQFLALALCVAAASLLAIYFVPNLWLWFPARFVLSAALNTLFVISEFWINQLADEKNRGRYVALYATCVQSGFGIGPLILIFIGTRGILPFALGAGLLLVGLIPVLLARHAAPRLEETSTASMSSLMRLAPVAIAGALVYGALDAGLVGLLPVYAVRSGYGEAQAALTVTAFSLGSIVFQYPLGWLADRMNRLHLLALCASTGVVGAAVTPFIIHTPWLFYALFFLWGGLILGVYSGSLTLLGEQFRGAELARANAGFVMAYSVGLLLAPPLEGAALDAWNPHGLLAVLGGISGAYVLFLMWQARRDPALTSPAP